MKIILIAAMDSKKGIGSQGRIPWHISQDFKRFKKITTGHPIVMGRKTFESIGKPLPGRTNIVLTRKRDLHFEGCVISHSIEDALHEAQQENAEKVFIIGGSEIYEQALPLADQMSLTRVQGVHRADAFFTFPEFVDAHFWQCRLSDLKEGDYDFEFIDYYKCPTVLSSSAPKNSHLISNSHQAVQINSPQAPDATNQNRPPVVAHISREKVMTYFSNVLLRKKYSITKDAQYIDETLSST